MPVPPDASPGPDWRPEPEPERRTVPSWRRVLPLGVLLACVGLVFALGLHRELGFEALREHRAALAGFVSENAILASLAYLALYTAAVAVSFPGASLLTVAGGVLFGTVHAAALTVAGATAGAIVLFLAARHAFAEPLRARAGPWLRRMQRGFERDAFSYLLTLRLLPVVPFWLVNLVPGLLGVRLGTFAASTALGIVPGTVVYAALGSGLASTLDIGGEPDLGILFRPAILLPLAGLALLSLAPVAWRALRRNRAA